MSRLKILLEKRAASPKKHLMMTESDELIDLLLTEFEDVVKKHDVLVERSVGAMLIAEGDDLWESVPIDCPMLAAVRDLRLQFLKKA